jgi:hypothetical protein
LEGCLKILSEKKKLENNYDKIIYNLEKEQSLIKKIKIAEKNMMLGLEENKIKKIVIVDDEEDDNESVEKEIFRIKALKEVGLWEEEKMFMPLYSGIKKYIRKLVLVGMKKTIEEAK